jgi:SSS family solute:Na+ symporter
MALIVSGILVIPLMRRLRLRTIPEFLQMRYGTGLRVLVGAFWGIRLCAFLGILLYIAATAAGVITGYDRFWVWIAAFSVVSLLYSVIGGAWAVAIMDSVQFLFMLFAGLVMFPVAMYAAGGVPNVLHWLNTHGYENHTRLIPQSGEFNWVFIFAMSMLSMKFATIDQAVLQRAFGARTPRVGAQGMVLSGIITTPFAFLYILPGMAVTQLHPGFENQDHAIPWLLSTYIPPIAKGLLGLILCGLLAAQISTITADVNSVATLFTSDVYRVIRRNQTTQRELVWTVRVCSVLCGILMLFMAWVVKQAGKGAVQANLAVVGILDLPLFVVAIIYGLLWKRANWQGATAGFVLGGVVGVSCYFLIDPKYFDGILRPALSHHSGSLATKVAEWHGWLKNYKQNLLSIAPIASASTALIVTPIVSLLTSKPESNHQINRHFHVQAEANHAEHPDDHDDFHLWPRSTAGRAGLIAVIGGYLCYLTGVLCAMPAQGIAPILAVGGMLIVFVGGLVRVYSK